MLHVQRADILMKHLTTECTLVLYHVFFFLDISGWREDDQLFLETHNFQAMFEKVKNQPYVMFIGVPGSGKTATARHIALKLQEDGYDILSIRDLNNIDTYCVQDKKHVFVIDDVLGIFGLEMNLFTLLYKFKDTLNNLMMSKTKVIMTCREEVYRNKHVSLLLDNFLRNQENLVLLHSEENELNDQDKRGLLEKYKIDALSQADLAATSNMFPYLCRLYKEFSNYGPKFFISPVYIMIKRLDEMEITHSVQYTSLVLLMLNQNKMSEKVLEENSEFSIKVKKDNILKICQTKSTTEGFEFLNALKRMEHTYTENRGGEFTFSHDSMFEMVAYHFGHRNPKLMIEYMSSDFIANTITVNEAYATENQSQKTNREDTNRGQNTGQGNVISLSINLQEDLYPHLVKRLYTDIRNVELCNVFENKVLKHPKVVQYFIREIEKKTYEEIRTVFLSEKRKYFETKQKKNDNQENEIKRHTWFMPNDSHLFFYEAGQPSVRAISWIIYNGHNQILQCIVDMIKKHKGQLDDLFLNSFNKPLHRPLAVKSIRKSRKVIYSDNVIGRENHLLRLGCFSGDPTTVKILLKEVHEDVRNNLYEPLVIACFNGHLGIVKDLIQAKADVNAVYKEDVTALIAACYGGHFDVVTELIKADADVNQAQYTVYWNPQEMVYGNGRTMEVNENSNGFHRVKWKTPLTAACDNGHSGIVELLIKKGADVNVKNKFCGTPLTTACENGNLSLVEMLLKNGANVTLEDSNEMVPLTAAHNQGHFDIVEKLIKNGCENGNKTLSAACYEGDIIAVKELITAGANANLKDGVIVPIKAACLVGHSEIVKELITAGADVNLKDGDQLPLITAGRRGHLSVVKELIKAGADINVIYKDETPLTSACRTNSVCVVRELINEGADVNQNHNEPLSIACEHGYLEITKELIKAGVNVNEKTAIDSPLATACRSGHVELVKILIESGSDVNLDSCLCHACSTKILPIVEYLLKAGANTDLNEALVCACNGKHSEQQLRIVQKLVKAGADVNWEGEDYGSPLQKASKNGYLSIVKELLKSGANVNLGEKHEPPLTMACAEGHLKVVKELVKAGADVNLVKEITTPLTVACLNGHSDVVEELLIAKANVNLGDGDASPLEIASYKGHYNIIKLLIKAGANVNLIYEHNSPLIAACQGMDLTTIQELLQSGANVNLNVEEETPLKAACVEGDLNIVEMLIAAGADVNLAVGKHSPLSIAYKCFNLDVINVLIEAGADTTQPRDKISGCCQCIS